MFARMAFLAFILAAASAARAEETLEELKSRLESQWKPWKGCEPGSWVQVKSKTVTGASTNESESRQTLVARDERGVTIETRAVTREKDAEGREVVKLGEPHRSTLPAVSGQTYENLKEVRREKVTVEGTDYDCRVVEMEAVYKYPQPVAGKTEVRAKVTMWFAEGLKEMGGVVRREADTENAGMFASASSDMSLVAVGKEMKIGSVTVKCSVFRYGNSTGKEEMTSSGEVWVSADLPTGYARTRVTMSHTSGGTRTNMEAESEVTDLHIETPKTE